MRHLEMLSVLLTLLASLACPGEATSVNFRTLPNARPPRARTLSAVRAADTQSYGFENLDDNNVYVADILVGGVPFSVQLDTGSSDTWVDTSLVSGRPLQAATDTGVGTETCYYDTTCANGNIWVANVTLGDFIITQQAIINAAGSNATYGGEIQGLMGLGPSSIAASTVVADLANRTDVNSEVFIDNVLRTHPETDNYMTFLLSRSESGNMTSGGVFTIGEVASGWDAVHNATKLPVVLDDSWSAVIDGFVVNGVPVTSNPSTIIPEPQPNQLLTLFDTGTTRAYAPMEVVTAIYENVPGAVFDSDWQEFTLPCDSKVNVSIMIGGKEIPIHPIDTVVLAEHGETERTDRDTSLCVGAFSAIQAYDTDVILGDTFLRNAYALFNFGSWTRPRDDGPYIQILGTTNQTQAFAEYDSLNAARLAARAEVQRVSTSDASRKASTAAALSWTLLSWVIAAVLLV